ncbi:hypothetical protein [Paenibacillus sp. L3-i20]|uniref:hypothetical protein n=1 Tax=Paenibacillus sp. L3-i20 TaxID=2905833 RepID=UPI001EDD8D6C|nr:hypothetical protein [Paenibacillus sp. L3-i20]GKU76886.1 hypothetical protein L3i20_v212830 [Paenibacillus sp. L3-i20]
MKVGDMAKPKGSPFPFQRIKEEDEGMYAIQWSLRNGVRHTTWYELDELEGEK